MCVHLQASAEVRRGAGKTEEFAHVLSELPRWFRTGWHGLRVDTGRWADGVHLDRTDRLCLVCKSLDCVEDEQHFVFDCPAYCYIRSQHLNLLQHCFLCEPNACGGFLRECFACRKQFLSV